MFFDAVTAGSSRPFFIIFRAFPSNVSRETLEGKSSLGKYVSRETMRGTKKSPRSAKKHIKGHCNKDVFQL